MNKYKILLFSMLLIVFFNSCKKEDIMVKNRTGNFFPLSVGNYWIYENSTYNINNFTGTKSDVLDTIRIIGTKIFCQ
jgi:hypothetical protein